MRGNAILRLQGHRVTMCACILCSPRFCAWAIENAKPITGPSQESKDLQLEDRTSTQGAV